MASSVIVPQGMRVIGLLGGVASGKSLVAQMLQEFGAGVLDADRAGHAVLELAPVIAAIHARWGGAVADGNGEIDRKRLAKIVFAPPPAGPRERKALEAITHPEIRRALIAQAEAYWVAGVRECVLDAPLLLEAGWDAWCDVLLFVDSRWPVRCARAATRGWTEAELRAREWVQRSVEEKRRRADWVIDNSGTPAETRAQVERFWLAWMGGSAEQEFEGVSGEHPKPGSGGDPSHGAGGEKNDREVGN